MSLLIKGETKSKELIFLTTQRKEAQILTPQPRVYVMKNPLLWFLQRRSRRRGRIEALLSFFFFFPFFIFSIWVLLFSSVSLFFSRRFCLCFHHSNVAIKCPKRTVTTLEKQTKASFLLFRFSKDLCFKFKFQKIYVLSLNFELSYFFFLIQQIRIPGFNLNLKRRNAVNYELCSRWLQLSCFYSSTLTFEHFILVINFKICVYLRFV